MRLYDELAAWWPLLSAPAEYAEEAGVYDRVLRQTIAGAAGSLLELGSGGGNNASHLKVGWRLTLVDRSERMLAVSRGLNPDCEHVRGDMLEVRLGRTFDAVFVHDAVCYLTTADQLAAVMATAFVHARPGGAVLVVPDATTETFRPGTSHGGHDGGGRGLRYLEWSHPPDPTEGTVAVDYVCVLRDTDGSVRTEYERHIYGLFSAQQWLDALAAAGFAGARQAPGDPEVESGVMFVATRPGQGG